MDSVAAPSELDNLQNEAEARSKAKMHLMHLLKTHKLNSKTLNQLKKDAEAKKELVDTEIFFSLQRRVEATEQNL